MTKSALRDDKEIIAADVPELPRIDDYYRWAYEQAAHIRAGRFDRVDILNVADEIESVGRNELRSLRSNAEIILLHMLKWRFQVERRTRSWALSIAEHRDNVLLDLEENPSMKVKTGDVVMSAYRLACRRAVSETGLPSRTFPETCPYSWEQIWTRHTSSKRVDVSTNPQAVGHMSCAPERQSCTGGILQR